MTINEFFGPAYLITVPPKVQKDKRWHELGLAVTARCESAVKQLREIGITPHYRWGIQPTDAGPFKTKGARGCTESHLAVVKEAKERKLDTVLIVEDDVKLWDDFENKWQLAEWVMTAYQWDLFYFYSKESAGMSDQTPRLLQVDGELHGHMYAVHSRFYDRYIEVVEAGMKEGKMQDEMLYFMPDKIVYAIHPPMAGQAAGYSAVGECEKPERYMPVERNNQ